MAALNVSAFFSNTVIPDTANTSISNPAAGSFKTVAVGSATVKRVIETIDCSAVATTTASMIMFFLYDGTNALPIPGCQINIPAWTMDLTSSPVRPPWGGPVPLPHPIQLQDNTWSIIVTVYTSQAIRVTANGKDYS